MIPAPYTEYLFENPYTGSEETAWFTCQIRYAVCAPRRRTEWCHDRAIAYREAERIWADGGQALVARVHALPSIILVGP